MASGVDLQTARDIYVLFIAHYVALAFFYYDYLVTFGDEVNFIWSKPKTQSAYWFAANRYIPFLTNIVTTVIRTWPLSEESCRKTNWFRQISLIVIQITVCVILTVRTYALYGRSRRILAFLVGFGAILIGASCYSVTGQSNIHAPSQLGCHLAFDESTSVRLAIPWEALFIYDTIIFSLTIFKSYKMGHRRGPLFTTSIPLLRLVVRDGAAYFAIMALANFANILTFYISGPHMRGGLTTFSSCMSVTMISRLLLNLHRSADQGTFAEVTDDTNASPYTRTGMIFTSRIDPTTSPYDVSSGAWEMQNLTLGSDEATLRSPTLV